MIRLALTACAAAATLPFLVGCGDRKAEVETPSASATVSTDQPEEVVPKPALEHAAANAAVEASAPGENTILPEGADKKDPLIRVTP